MTRSDGVGGDSGTALSGSSAPVSVVFLPVDPAGCLQAADLRGLAFSAGLARMLASVGREVLWWYQADATLLSGLPGCLLPPWQARSAAGHNPRPADGEPILLVYAAARHTAASAEAALGAAVHAPGGVSHHPLQPIRWLDDEADENQARSEERHRLLPLADLVDAFGEASLVWWCLSRAASQPVSLHPSRLRAATLTNPLYRVQLARVRIDCALRQLARRQHTVCQGIQCVATMRQQAPAERRLRTLIDAWPVLIRRATQAGEPHRVISHLLDLANALHIYYTKNDVPDTASGVPVACTCLLNASRQRLTDGLALFGITIPEVI